MARVTVSFASGVREDVDPKVMPEGALKRAENLRMRRDGRLGVRYGYTALALTRAHPGSPSSGLVASDIIGFNDRLLALATNPGFDDTPPRDIYEYVNQAQFAWRPTDNDNEMRLGLVTSLRNMGSIQQQRAGLTNRDISAGGGLVLLVFFNSNTNICTVHVFDPDTDTTILYENLADTRRPRTVCVGSVFFVMAESTSTTGLVKLWRFDPSTDSSMTALTDAFASGDAINYSDMSLSESGSNFVCVINRSTPSTSIRSFNSSGTATQTIVGPAVAATFVSALRQSARIHLLVAESSDRHLDLYTYETAGGTLENTTLDLASGIVVENQYQPALCMTYALSDLMVAAKDDASEDAYFIRIDPSTHTVVATVTWHGFQFASKPCVAPTTEIFAGNYDTTTDLFGQTTFIGSVGVTRTVPDEIVHATLDVDISKQSGSNLSHIAKDASTGKFYVTRLVRDSEDTVRIGAAEFVFGAEERRQVAAIDNQLYIAGGVPQSFAGRAIVEAGFINRPVILSATPSNGSGSLTPSETYSLVAVYEWYDEQGRLHQSEPSEVVDVTMGASEDTITLSVSGPFTSRVNATTEEFDGVVFVVIYRTTPNTGSQLLRSTTSQLLAGRDFGSAASVTVGSSDASIEDNAVIYTQGASGARSGPNPFVSPLPCRYIWASADKLITGGLPQEAQIQESRAAFPNEPITWARNLGGISSAPERVLGVAVLDGRRLAFTANAIFEFVGEGLDINGVGDLGFPRRLPSPGGLYGGDLGWRSLVATHVGVFFQLAADSIFLLPRGGEAPVFVGKPVRDTLASFPNITSATYLKTEQLVCFTCTDAGITDSVILVYDLEHGQWFVDTETTGLLSSCEYQGRLVILKSSGAIEQQNATHPASAFISTLVETGTIYPFGQGGQGQVDEIQFFGEFRGNCVVTMYLSYNDGKTYPVSKAFNLSTSGTPAYTAGDTVTLKWAPNQMRGDRVRLKVECTALAGAATEGIVYNYATLDFTPSGRSALRDTAQKG